MNDADTVRQTDPVVPTPGAVLTVGALGQVSLRALLERLGIELVSVADGAAIGAGGSIDRFHVSSATATRCLLGAGGGDSRTRRAGGVCTRSGIRD